MLIVDGKLISKFVKDYRGEVFGKLTVVKFDRIDKGKSRWWCLCNCGNKVSVKTNSLVSGCTRSCGCLSSEMARERNRRNKKEVLHTAERHAWKNMLERCYNENHQYFRHYGGRGIKVCQRYRESFEAFLADIGPRPGKTVKGERSRYSLDRIRNDRSYDCGRCEECITSNLEYNLRWATMEEQARNMRSNHLVTYKGETKPLIEWTEEFGLRYDSVLMRINSYGWSIEDALEKPLTKDKRGLFPYQGRSLSISDWAKEFGMSYYTLWSRLKRGMSLAEALETPVISPSKK